MKIKDELILLSDADERAASYLKSVETKRVFPEKRDIEKLSRLGGALPETTSDPIETLQLLDEIGGAGTVTSNGPNYYGFVIGATLPVAAATDRLAAAWDQCASSALNSPTMAKIEDTAGDWLLEILDLPREAGVGFGTSATACGLSCLAIARAGLLEKLGWDVTEKGLSGAPVIKVIVSEVVHVTIKKALKLLGFGTQNVLIAPVDDCGRIIPEQMPECDDKTILCLQAGEVNTGEFDLFSEIIPSAKAKGAWVHVDGAFGLWARASRHKQHLTKGIELADSWTTDGHKWLNTPYDSAVAICRHKELQARTLNGNAAYATAPDTAQSNMTLEFSRKARGLGFWAVLRSLGREGVEQLVDQYCGLAQEAATGIRKLGITVHNRVVLNQVLCSFDDEQKTKAFLAAVQADGAVWFGQSIWQGRTVFRISVSSWRTEKKHIQNLIAALERRV